MRTFTKILLVEQGQPREGDAKERAYSIDELEQAGCRIIGTHFKTRRVQVGGFAHNGPFWQKDVTDVYVTVQFPDEQTMERMVEV